MTTTIGWGGGHSASPYPFGIAWRNGGCLVGGQRRKGGIRGRGQDNDDNIDEEEEEEEEEEGEMTEGQHRWHTDNNDAIHPSASLAGSKKAAATSTTQRPPATMATTMTMPSEAATMLLAVLVT